MSDDTQASATDAPAQVDTADTQTSEASTQLEAAPEANQETVAQDSNQTDVKADDTAGDKLFAGKYKSAEEMEKAYLSLQSKNTRDNQEKAELNRILNEAFATPAPTQAAATDDSFQEDDSVTREIEGLKRTTAVQSFIMAHPEADATAMQKVLQDDPIIKQIPGHDAKLEYAYLRSQNMAQPKAIAEAQQKAANQATVKIAEKQAAQVESARKSEQIDEQADLHNRMTTGPIQQREAARRDYIKKYLVQI